MRYRHGDRSSLGWLSSRRQNAPLDPVVLLQHEDNMLRTNSFLKVCKDLRLVSVGLNTKRHLVISIRQRPHVIAVFAHAAGMRLPIDDNLAGLLFKFRTDGPRTHSGNHPKLGNPLVPFCI